MDGPPAFPTRSLSVGSGLGIHRQQLQQLQGPTLLRTRSSTARLIARRDTIKLQRLIVVLAIAAAFTTIIVFSVVFPPAVDDASQHHERPRSLPPLPRLRGLSATEKDAVAGALAVDALLRPQAEICPDPYGVFGPSTRLADMLDDLSFPFSRGTAELKQLRSGRYFLVALMHDDEELLPFWQRELTKVLLLLGNSARDNLFVSVLEVGSKDKTKICAMALADLLYVLGISHSVASDRESGAADDDAIDAARDMPRLRNKALRPLYEARGAAYDAVVHISVSHFCSASVVALVAAVQNGGSSGGGGGADVACSMDYTHMALRGTGFGPVKLEAADLWTARDRGGCQMVDKAAPHWCDPEAQARFRAGLPVPLFSCWDAVVVTRADLFQRIGLRFRAPTDMECRQAETELFCRDAWTAGRGRILMLPGAATALEWEAFYRIVGAAAPAQNTGRARGVAAAAAAAAPGALFSEAAAAAAKALLAAEAALPAPVRPPAAVACCPMDDVDDTVRLKECFEDRHWGRGAEVLRAALDRDAIWGSAGAGVAEVRAADRVATAAVVAAAPVGAVTVAGSASAGSLAMHLSVTVEERLHRYIEHKKESAFCRDMEAGMAALAGNIPRHVVHFGGAVTELPRDVQNRLALSALSFVAAHDGCYGYSLVTDEKLLSLAAELSEHLPEPIRNASRLIARANSSETSFDDAGPAAWLQAVPRAEMRVDILRLLYMFHHGGIMAPPVASAAGPVAPHLRPGDSMLLGFVEAGGASHLLFMAVAPGHPVVADMVARTFRELRDPAHLYRARVIRGYGAADARERYFASGLGVMLEAVRAARRAGTAAGGSGGGSGGAGGGAVSGGSSNTSGVRAVKYPAELSARFVGRPQALCHAGAVTAAATSAPPGAAISGIAAGTAPPFLIDVRLYADPELKGSGGDWDAEDDDDDQAAGGRGGSGGSSGERIGERRSGNLPEYVARAAWPGGRRSVRLTDGEIIRPMDDFDFLRDGHALLNGQWLPTWWGDPAALGHPLWASLALTNSEKALAARRDAEGEFYVAVDAATGALELFAGAGPLDPSKRRLRVLCPPPRAKSSAMPGTGGPSESAREEWTQQAGGNGPPERFLQFRSEVGLQLRSLQRVSGTATHREGIWADTVWMPPGRYNYPRRRDRAYLVLRRDGRLAAYMGVEPPRPTAFYDPQVGDDVAAWVDQQCQPALRAWREGQIDCLAGNEAARGDSHQGSGGGSGTTCLDTSRCRGGSDGSAKLSVYIYDSRCSLRNSTILLKEFEAGAASDGAHDDDVSEVTPPDPSEPWRRAAAHLGLLAETPDEACMLLYVLPPDLTAADMDEMEARGGICAQGGLSGCLNSAATWRNGTNHVLVSEGFLPPYRLAKLFGRAALVNAHPLACAHRVGYDVSLPPPAAGDPAAFASLGGAAIAEAQAMVQEADAAAVLAAAQAAVAPPLGVSSEDAEVPTAADAAVLPAEAAAVASIAAAAAVAQDQATGNRLGRRHVLAGAPEEAGPLLQVEPVQGGKRTLAAVTAVASAAILTAGIAAEDADLAVAARQHDYLATVKAVDEVGAAAAPAWQQRSLAALDALENEAHAAVAPARQRRYLATFEGVFRVGGFASGYLPGTQRGRLWALDNGEDVRISMLCVGDPGPRSDISRLCGAMGVDRLAPKQRPVPLELLNTTFAFVPGGQRPATRRLGEAMLAGCVPVIYADGFVPPLQELIRWDSLAIIFASGHEANMIPTLRAIPPERTAAMGAAAVAAAREYLSDDAKRYEHVYQALASHLEAPAT